MKTRALIAAACLALAAGPLAAQNSNPLGALGSILGNLQQQAGKPAPANNPLGALLSGGQATPAAPAANDLIALLSQEGAIDEAKEIEIGRQLAAVLLGSKPMHPDMALQRYVNQLGRWIGLQSSRPQLPWTFTVLDDPGFNAFAAPGGFVFVTKGLVDRVDEGELAGILAHEASHVTERHHLNALRQKARAGAFTQLIGSQIRTGNAVGSLVSQQVLNLVRNLYSSGLDQEDEFDADRQGVVLAARAGFDPYGLPGVLQQLRTQVPDDPLFALSLSTHPPAQQRLDALAQAMGNRLDPLAGKPVVRIDQRLSQPRR
jgi:predicted Zn-dependent protease